MRHLFAAAALLLGALINAQQPTFEPIQVTAFPTTLETEDPTELGPSTGVSLTMAPTTSVSIMQTFQPTRSIELPSSTEIPVTTLTQSPSGEQAPSDPTQIASTSAPNTLVPTPPSSSSQSGVCTVESHDCSGYEYNGKCNEGNECDLGTDCFDCQPCQDYRYMGCEACTAAGCVWCGSDAICFDAKGDFSVKVCPLEDYSFTLEECGDAEAANPYPDPLFSSMEWIYDQINVKEVWAAGISK